MLWPLLNNSSTSTFSVLFFNSLVQSMYFFFYTAKHLKRRRKNYNLKKKKKAGWWGSNKRDLSGWCSQVSYFKFPTGFFSSFLISGFLLIHHKLDGMCDEYIHLVLHRIISSSWKRHREKRSEGSAQMRTDGCGSSGTIWRLRRRPGVYSLDQ